jgi:hypothetical protein
VDKSQKITIIEIAILFIAGLFPILWFSQGSILAFGDDFPLYLNAHKVFSAGPYLWSTDYLGYATPAPAYLLYQYSGAFLSIVGLSISQIQITTKVFLFLVAGLSMFYLTKKIYPQYRFAAFIAGFFYLFNFFVLLDVSNIGFIWTYAFLPLLLGLFYTAITANYQQDKKAANKHIIYFALVSVVAFSFASINPANVALLIIGLVVLAFYFVIKYRKQMRLFWLALGKIVGATFPLNLWWIIPVLGSFVFSSSQALNSQISIQAWDWTQNRASFLNLFWLNGYWDWKTEYYPYANSYLNPILAILVFVPFIIAGAALLFKSNKSRFNAYIMATILCFLFLAKGLHEPFRPLNIFLYNTVPLMSVFREPVSKFTLVLMPFLALLVGYGSEHIANLKVFLPFQLQSRKSIQLPSRLKPRIIFHHNNILVLALIAIIFLVSVYPLFENTTQITIEDASFSSSIQIPSYWYQATGWINSQQGNWRVLITPLDDFYQMPYTWGYYGTDQLIDRLIEKPIVSTDVLNSYVVNPQTASTMQELNYAMRDGKVNEFKALLDLLNVKYIFQRNDVVSNLTGRTTLPDGILASQSSIMSPDLVKSFFEIQSYLQLVRTFGALDIYEYADSKPSFYATTPLLLQQSNISIQTKNVFQREWNFSNTTAINDLKSLMHTNGFAAPENLEQDGSYARVDLLQVVGASQEIDFPSLSSQYGNLYTIAGSGLFHTCNNVNITIIQYGKDNTMLNNRIAEIVSYSSHNSSWIYPWNFNFTFEPSKDTDHFKIQLWFDIFGDNYPCSLWISDVKVTGINSALNITGLDEIFSQAVQNQAAEVLNVQRVNPAKILVTVNASHTFVLATTEAFDNYWVANVNGQQISPTPLYLGLQGYYINKSGQLQITLEYKPQTWFYSASAISAVTAIILLVLLAYFSRERMLQVINKFKKY